MEPHRTPNRTFTRTTLIRLSCAALTALGVLWTSGRARAGVYLSQPPSYTSAYCSTTGTVLGSTYAVWDNFSITGDTEITAIAWQGLSADLSKQGPASELPQAFSIYIAFDPGSGPGRAAYIANIAGAPNATFARDMDAFGNGQMEPVYDYYAVLDVPWKPLAVNYQISIQATQASPSVGWFWTSGSGGNGTCLQAVNFMMQPRAGDRTFTLYNSLSIPEPATLALLSAALPAFVLRRRRPVGRINA